MLLSKSLFLRNVTCRSEIFGVSKQRATRKSLPLLQKDLVENLPGIPQVSTEKTYNEQKYQERELIPEKLVHHFRNEKGTGAEIRPAMFSGIITEDVPVIYWLIFLLFQVTVREVSAKINSPQFPFSFSRGKWPLVKL